MSSQHRMCSWHLSIIIACIWCILPLNTGSAHEQLHSGTPDDRVQGERTEIAATHMYGAAHVFWQFQGAGDDFWQVDQIMWVDQKAPSTYWAQSFTFTGSPDGGYIGLQTDGYRFDGTRGELAIFSLWNANGVRGASCDTFTGEGDGLSCRIPFTIKVGLPYRLRVWRLETDSGGTWWGGWVKVGDSQQDYHIGDIRVPSVGRQVFGGVMNFSEYFGPPVPCNRVPQSIVHFTQPAANLDTSSGSYAYYSRFSQFRKLECTDASSTPMDYGWTQGVELVLGTRFENHQIWLPTIRRQ